MPILEVQTKITLIIKIAKEHRNNLGFCNALCDCHTIRELKRVTFFEAQIETRSEHFARRVVSCIIISKLIVPTSDKDSQVDYLFFKNCCLKSMVPLICMAIWKRNHKFL